MVLSWIKLGAHPILEDLHLYTYILHPSIHPCMHAYIHTHVYMYMYMYMYHYEFNSISTLLSTCPRIAIHSAESKPVDQYGIPTSWAKSCLIHGWFIPWKPRIKRWIHRISEPSNHLQYVFFFLNHIWITVISFLWQSCLIFKKVIMENQCSISFLEINLRISYNPCIIVF